MNGAAAVPCFHLIIWYNLYKCVIGAFVCNLCAIRIVKRNSYQNMKTCWYFELECLRPFSFTIALRCVRFFFYMRLRDANSEMLFNRSLQSFQPRLKVAYAVASVVLLSDDIIEFLEVIAKNWAISSIVCVVTASTVVCYSTVTVINTFTYRCYHII